MSCVRDSNSKPAGTAGGVVTAGNTARAVEGQASSKWSCDLGEVEAFGVRFMTQRIRPRRGHLQPVEDLSVMAGREGELR